MPQTTIEPILIKVPDTIQDQASQIVVDALIEAGVNPRLRATLNNRMVQAGVLEWRDGRWTRGQFVANMRKLLIMNPKLGDL